MPRAFKACCALFESHTLSCYYDIRYEWWSKARGWFTVIAPLAGGGGIAIHYCPHCGTKLAGSKNVRTAKSRRVHPPKSA